MPLAQSPNRHPCIMAISPWSIPFFSPQKRVVGSFLREVNVGISSAPTPHTILKWNIIIDIISDKFSRDDGMHLWQCPSVSLHEANVVCPIVLYGAKTVPPTRAERRQKMRIRRQHPHIRYWTQSTTRTTTPPEMQPPTNRPTAAIVLCAMPQKTIARLGIPAQ